MESHERTKVLASSVNDLSKDKLIKLIIQQAELIDKLRKETGELKRRVQELEKLIEELERKSHRQAAPFRREGQKKVTDPHPPGRREGHPGSYRQVGGELDETIEVPLTRCPTCRGSLESVKPIRQIIEELPLISDCLVVYDDVNQKQQKCYAHHLKAIKKAREKHDREGKGFLQETESLLKTALLIKKIKSSQEFG